jgi:DUF2961 family protein
MLPLPARAIIGRTREIIPLVPAGSRKEDAMRLRSLALPSALLAAAAAFAQGVASPTLELARLQPAARSRRASSHDVTGGNSDNVSKIAPGTRRDLFDVKGAGIITHIWVTIAPPPPALSRHDVILRMYWDGETAPSDLGRFHAWYNHVLTEALPEGENEWSVLGVQGKNTTGDRNYLIADIVGKGHYVGVNYYVDDPSPMWYGEGDVPPFPSRASRKPMPSITEVDIHLWRDAWRRAHGSRPQPWGNDKEK